MLPRPVQRVEHQPQAGCDAYCRKYFATPAVITPFSYLLSLGKLFSGAGQTNLGATEAILWFMGDSKTEERTYGSSAWLLIIGLIASIADFGVNWQSRLQPITQRVHELALWQFKDIYMPEKLLRERERALKLQEKGWASFYKGFLKLWVWIAIGISVVNVFLASWLGGVQVQEDIGIKLIYNNFAEEFGGMPIIIPPAPEHHDVNPIINILAYYIAVSGVAVFGFYQAPRMFANSTEKSLAMHKTHKLIFANVPESGVLAKSIALIKIMGNGIVSLCDLSLQALYTCVKIIVGPLIALYALGSWAAMIKNKGWNATRKNIKEAINDPIFRKKLAISMVLALLVNTLTTGSFLMKHAVETWPYTKALELDESTLITIALLSQIGNLISTLLGRASDVYEWVDKVGIPKKPKQENNASRHASLNNDIDLEAAELEPPAAQAALQPAAQAEPQPEKSLFSTAELSHSKKVNWYVNVAIAFINLGFEFLIGIKSTNSFLKNFGVDGRGFIRDKDWLNLYWYTQVMVFLLAVRLVSAWTFTNRVALVQLKTKLENRRPTLGDEDMDGFYRRLNILFEEAELNDPEAARIIEENQPFANANLHATAGSGRRGSGFFEPPVERRRSDDLQSIAEEDDAPLLAAQQ